LIDAGSQSLRGIWGKGGFDYIQSEADAETIIQGMRDEIDNGSYEIGFETYWIIGRRAIS
jgi:hypothetical protein